jgi:uroporphyrinogen-III decarboxylase
MSTETMTPRERLLAALRFQEVDRIPWSPCLDGYFLGPQPDQIAAFRRLRADAMIRHALNFIGSVPMRITAPPPGRTLAFSVTKREKGDETEYTYECPVGTLTERCRHNPESPNIPWTTKHRLQTIADVKVLQWMCEKAEFAPIPAFYELYAKALGDDGLVTISMLGTPILWTINSETTLDKFWFLYADHPAEMEEFFEAAHQMNLRMARAIAEGPGEVVIQYENLSSTLCSPAIWEKYAVRWVNEYADLLHSAGKIFLQHNCGHLKAFGDRFRQLRFDGCTDIAIPPTGSITLGEARELWGPDKVICGGIDATAFSGLNPSQMKDYVRRLLRDFKDRGRGYILGSGDATPKTATWENLLAVTEVVEAEGRYPLGG